MKISNPIKLYVVVDKNGVIRSGKTTFFTTLGFAKRLKKELDTSAAIMGPFTVLEYDIGSIDAKVVE